MTEFFEGDVYEVTKKLAYEFGSKEAVRQVHRKSIGRKRRKS